MTAEISPRVMNMVRRRILEDPTVTNDVLFAAAVEMEPQVEALNMRQFNARYPLRVRRWELSERTRILHPTGPLSKAAAENPAAPISPRAHLTLTIADNADGANASQTQDSAPQPDTKAQPRTQATLASTTATPPAESRPPQAAAPSLQARITAPRPAAQPLATPKPPAPAEATPPSSRRAGRRPSASEAAAATEPEASVTATTVLEPALPVRRRRGRAPRQPAEDARAEVIMVMLRWATAIGQASAIPEVFATLSTVDDYVDHIARVLDMP